MIDLRKCKKGDILISQHGAAFVYVEYVKGDYFPHIIKNIGALDSEGYCSRLDNGRVFKNKSLPEDHDIVRVIKKKAFLKLLNKIN